VTADAAFYASRRKGIGAKSYRHRLSVKRRIPTCSRRALGRGAAENLEEDESTEALHRAVRAIRLG